MKPPVGSITGRSNSSVGRLDPINKAKAVTTIEPTGRSLSTLQKKNIQIQQNRAKGGSDVRIRTSSKLKVRPQSDLGNPMTLRTAEEEKIDSRLDSISVPLKTDRIFKAKPSSLLRR